jgi:glutathione synthase/RimK-type ligase-like ATP-grasp enzyme
MLRELTLTGPLSYGPDVLLIIDPIDGTDHHHDAPLLAAALAARGLDVEIANLADCFPVIGDGPLQVLWRGAPVLPRIVVNRVSEDSWPSASRVIEAFIGLTKVVNAAGLPVAADKWSTAQALAAHGIAQIPTRYVPANGLMRGWPQTDAGRRIGFRGFVAKSPFGAGGRHVYMLEAEEVAREPMLTQPYAFLPADLHRVLIVDGEPVLDQFRLPDNPLLPGNIMAGAEHGSREMHPAVAAIARTTARALGLTTVAGLDIPLFGDRAAVLEVNACPGLMSAQADLRTVNLFEMLAAAIHRQL